MKRPIVAAAVLWVAGYSLAAKYADITWLSWLGWKAGLAALLLWALLGAVKLPGGRWIQAGLLLLMAAAYYSGYDARNTTSLPASLQGAEVLVEGIVVSTVEVDGDKAAFTLLASRATGGADNLLQRRERLQVTIRLLQQPEQAAAARWGRGDRIQIAGSLKAPEPARNFGGFDYRRYLYRSHRHWLLTAKGLDAAAASPPNPRAHPGLALLRANDAARAYLGSRFDRLFDPLQAGYMKSLVLGITEDLDPERFQQFSRLGLTHVLAISGLHVAVFVAGCLALMRRLGLTREKALVAAMLLLPLYTAIAGGSPSVVRAGLMAMIALYAARRGVLKDGLHILCAVALLMLVWEPYNLFNVSFQLSFIVTAGLILGVPRMARLLPQAYPKTMSAIAVTTVAQLISFPISIYYFNSLSLLSWLANFLLVPFISFVTLPIGSVALLVSLISMRAGEWVAWLADASNRLTFWMVEQGGHVRGMQTIWATPSIAWIAAYGLGLSILYAALMYRKSGGRGWPAAAAGLFLLLLLLGAYAGAPTKLILAKFGTVSFLDVGQGDAILIRTPHGRNVLIDGGGTVSFRKPGEEWKERRDPYEVGAKLLVPLLKKRGIQQLDYVVISHQDADHIGGLQAVVEQIPVKHVVFNDSWKGNAGSRKLFETAIRQGAKLLGGDAGDKLALDEESEMYIMAPPQDGGSGPELIEEQNGASLILMLRMFDTRFLLTGDSGIPQEEELMTRLQAGGGSKNPLDVLKVGHHGSKNSTSADWVAYWKPKQAVISVGASNVYGHPNAQVVERLTNSGAQVQQTDLQGEIAYQVNQRGWSVRTKLGLP